ncbi:MAG: VOC family protein [Rubricella sp.]
MPHVPEHALVWCEIPVTDLDRAETFYRAVFDFAFDRMEGPPNPFSIIRTTDEKSGISGHLYPGKPSSEGPTVHLLVPGKLEDAMARCTEAGGRVISDPIPIPAGRFAYAHDPDGNSIGLFEAAAG